MIQSTTPSITSSPNDKMNELWCRLEVALNSKHLGFLVTLDTDIDYNQHKCSIGRLRQLMTILEVNQEALLPQTKKDMVVQHHRKFAAPMGSLQGSLPEFNRDVRMTIATNSSPECSKSVAAASNSSPTSSGADLRNPVPGRRSNSMVEELWEGLKKNVKKLVSQRFTKSALVKLQLHIENKTGWEISTKDCDTIRKILQGWCPQLGIPLNVAMSRPILLALYNLICMEPEEPGLFQGVHFDIFPLHELQFDECFTF
ncbi:hypothetical protein DFH28DRAFT_1086383 [Melampsora americana]|nr:hypothetical protein DFH28DRAFT_1086383 [Melampsora americana]